MKDTLILGSQSPRRKEILSFFNLPFEQITSDYDESELAFTGDPVAYAAALSSGKAATLNQKYPEAHILTADTIVSKEGTIFGKPTSFENAVETLSTLQGSWHSVYTALTLSSKGKLSGKVEETRVLFNPLTMTQIRHYLTQLQWADKAGGYAIQMSGSLIVNRIEGCYYNVMGLPINPLRELLSQIGIDLWERLCSK